MKQESGDDNRTETRRCRVCGCDDLNACVDEATGETCCWVEDDLCSRCAEAMDEHDPDDLEADAALYATAGMKKQMKEDAKAVAEEEAKDLVDVIRDGMAENAGNAPLCYMGELLTDWTMRNPGKAVKADTKGKTLKGAMDAMRSAAQKKASGSVGVLTDAEGVKIALEYFGLNQETQAPADPLDLDALLGQ